VIHYHQNSHGVLSDLVFLAQSCMGS